MKRFFLFALLALPLAFSCANREENKEYEPIELFAPAYTALGESGADAGSYNLDATIRIIRAIELASQESSDFGPFLDKLAAQDYRYVAKDVLEAERALFPVLQKMYLMQSDYDRYQGVWGVVSTANTALGELDSEVILSAIQDPLQFVTGGTLWTVVGEAFDAFAKTNKIKSEKRKKLEEVKAEYVAAQQQCRPVFLKYKEQWEKLCLKKDQAYLDVYDNRCVSAYNMACDILKDYPDDRDALLIKAMALASMPEFDYKFQTEADATLTHYMNLYPTRTAPALLIKGIVADRSGNREEAFSNYNHAAIEYPRQAAALTDMLDAYLNRPYFKKTHEGLYFQQMYRATLEGYGMFSPNFRKALSLDASGNRAAAQREIYDHFFRRGNQVVHDYLLSDMEFCEKNLHDAFVGAFPQGASASILVEGVRPIVGKKHLDITLINRSGTSLQNVRLFVCYHLVGMYPGDYVVEELSAVNSISAESTYKWSSREYSDKDIVYTRAVLLTDDHICWVNSPEYLESLTNARPEPAPQEKPSLTLPSGD